MVNINSIRFLLLGRPKRSISKLISKGKEGREWRSGDSSKPWKNRPCAAYYLSRGTA